MEHVVDLQHIDKSYDGDVALTDVSLTIMDGEFLTLLGPSGCGKTTVLRILGGFEQCDSGVVHIDGRSMDTIPPEKRPVNTVFQSYALFPHMSVFDNVAFGLRMAGMKEADIAAEVARVLKLVHLEPMAHRMPSALSGGQQQRVAIARAVVNKPRVLLLDEPLSALDYRLRRDMQKDLKELQRTLGITFVLVTHDQEEAFSMSDRVAVMNHGRIEQIGTPKEIYEEPVNLYVAHFVGEINVLDGIVTGKTDNGYSAEVEGADVMVKSGREFQVGDKFHLLLRPEDFRVEVMSEVREDPSLAKKFDKALLTGVVDDTCYKGATYDVDITLGHGKSILVSEYFDEDAETLYFHPGDRVAVGWFEGWEVVLPVEE